MYKVVWVIKGHPQPTDYRLSHKVIILHVAYCCHPAVHIKSHCLFDATGDGSQLNNHQGHWIIIFCFEVYNTTSNEFNSFAPHLKSSCCSIQSSSEHSRAAIRSKRCIRLDVSESLRTWSSRRNTFVITGKLSCPSRYVILLIHAHLNHRRAILPTCRAQAEPRTGLADSQAEGLNHVHFRRTFTLRFIFPSKIMKKDKIIQIHININLQ